MIVDLGKQGQPQDTRGAGIDTLIGIENVRGTDFSDRLIGSAGDDSLDGGYGGSDRLTGGAGDDILAVQPRDTAEPVRSVLSGGFGDDIADIFMEGSPANAAVFVGGAGDDQLYAMGQGQVTASMGGGADLVVLSYALLDRSVTLGAGADTIRLQSYGDPDSNIAAVITDFAVGSHGDRIDLSDLLAGFATGYRAGDNPFATGRLTLTRCGGGDPGVVLNFDPDGTAGAASASRILVLEDVNAGALTAFNFTGFDPHVAAMPMSPHGSFLHGVTDALGPAALP